MSAYVAQIHNYYAYYHSSKATHGSRGSSATFWAGGGRGVIIWVQSFGKNILEDLQGSEELFGGDLRNNFGVKMFFRTSSIFLYAESSLSVFLWWLQRLGKFVSSHIPFSVRRKKTSLVMFSYYVVLVRCSQYLLRLPRMSLHSVSAEWADLAGR